MKTLKTIGIVVGVLVAIFLIIAAVSPKHVEYERSTEINAPKEVVYAVIDDLKATAEWDPWTKADPTMKVTYGEKTSGVGASYSWTSQEMGNGTMTVTEATPPTLQKSHLTFDGQGEADAWMRLEDGENGATKTSWGMGMDAGFPFNAIFVFTDMGMGKMFEDGLANLKKVCEERAAQAPAAASGSLEVKPIDYPGATYLGARETAKFEDVMSASFFADRFGKVGALAGKTKIEMAGAPAGVYFTWDEANKKTEVAVSMPVKKGTNVNGDNIKTFEVPAGKALLVDYYGGYSGISKAHEAMMAYMQANNLTQGSPVIEEYISDPGTEPDSNKWLTKLYYMLK